VSERVSRFLMAHQHN